jgi:hypothetical protein
MLALDMHSTGWGMKWGRYLNDPPRLFVSEIKRVRPLATGSVSNSQESRKNGTPFGKKSPVS